MKKVLMVCLGNICRSPIAHGLLRNKVEKYQLNVEVDSAGTSGFHAGEKADGRSIKTMEDHGININDLRSRRFTTTDFDKFDIIFAMDKSNYNNLMDMAKSEQDRGKIRMLLNLSYPNQNLEVPDPYYGGDEGFENVYKMIDHACDILIEELKS